MENLIRKRISLSHEPYDHNGDSTSMLLPNIWFIFRHQTRIEEAVVALRTDVENYHPRLFSFGLILVVHSTGKAT